ncbi:MAG TPA: hypothetical protein VFW33_05860 [Gemmataceae bacterium]|nr:hypothetical protein [Gemmataceae bacterium]
MRRVLSTQCSVLSTLLVLLALPPAARADDEPPIVGQPPHFNGAVGRFRAGAAVDPPRVQAEDPLTYTVRITAEGKVKEPPQRPPLAEFPGFSDGFYLEDLGPPEGTHPDASTWEFTYRLKPKSTAVKAVPGFPFVSYRPGFLPPKAGYMTVYVPELPITVTPRQEVGAGPGPAKPVVGPDEAFVPARGDVLAPDGERLPGPLVLVLAVLLPPLGAVAWYVVWRRLYPDAARLSRRRRSRAAQEALKALHQLGRHADPEKQARRSAATVAAYLRNRLELPTVEPTPAEAAAHLKAQGVAEDLAGQTADLLRRCAAVRFDPDPPAPSDLADAAERLILALEAATWSE